MTGNSKKNLEYMIADCMDSNTVLLILPRKVVRAFDEETNLFEANGREMDKQILKFNNELQEISKKINRLTE